MMRDVLGLGMLALLASLFSVAVAHAAAPAAGKYTSYYQQMKSGDSVAKVHGDAGLNCESCHGKKSNFSKLDVRQESCVTCHDVDAINKKVSFKHINKVVTPHKQHVGDIGCVDCHSVHGASQLACQECHMQPWMNTLSPRWKIKK